MSYLNDYHEAQRHLMLAGAALERFREAVEWTPEQTDVERCRVTLQEVKRYLAGVESTLLRDNHASQAQTVDGYVRMIEETLRGLTVVDPGAAGGNDANA